MSRDRATAPGLPTSVALTDPRSTPGVFHFKFNPFSRRRTDTFDSGPVAHQLLT
jgi:hypothetical protein